MSEATEAHATLFFLKASGREIKEQSQQSFIMQAANRLQKALGTGSGLSFGAWQMLPGANLSRTIARCGFDWITVDTEHGNIDGKKTYTARENNLYQDWTKVALGNRFGNA